jgi:hypothetical protein
LLTNLTFSTFSFILFVDDLNDDEREAELNDDTQDRLLHREQMLEKKLEMNKNRLIRSAMLDDKRFWRDVEPHEYWLTTRSKNL